MVRSKMMAEMSANEFFDRLELRAMDQEENSKNSQSEQKPQTAEEQIALMKLIAQTRKNKEKAKSIGSTSGLEELESKLRDLERSVQAKALMSALKENVEPTRVRAAELAPV